MAEEEHMAAFFLSEIHQKYKDNVAEINNIREVLLELKENSKRLSSLSGEELKNASKSLEDTAENLSVRLKDVSGFLEFYLKDKNSVGIVLLERDTYMKINQILRWNKADVRELKRWINELKDLASALGRNPHDLLSFRRLPTVKMPEVALKYPAWAMDKNGYCLTGTDYNEIMHIDEVIDEMESGENPFPVHPVSSHYS
ncbi:MAG: hypothetical protein PHP13_06015 [Methanomicrobium sp.]|nr:hypothetical protein [Methanomicrobium sp.]MDD4300476.1 hypothetical protein [Methanomicrobium sp.]